MSSPKILSSSTPIKYPKDIILGGIFFLYLVDSKLLVSKFSDHFSFYLKPKSFSKLHVTEEAIKSLKKKKNFSIVIKGISKFSEKNTRAYQDLVNLGVIKQSTKKKRKRDHLKIVVRNPNSRFSATLLSSLLGTNVLYSDYRILYKRKVKYHITDPRHTKSLKSLDSLNSLNFSYKDSRTFKDYAEVHSNSNLRISFDIKNYFPSITPDRFFAVLEKDYDIKFSSFEKSLIANLCFTESDGLPQGSPLSPIYSNIYLNVFDQKAQEIGKKYGLSRYSRYCDNISFSRSESGHYEKQKIKNFCNEIDALVKEYSLILNYDKTEISFSKYNGSYGPIMIGPYNVSKQSPRLLNTDTKRAIYLYSKFSILVNQYTLFSQNRVSPYFFDPDHSIKTYGFDSYYSDPSDITRNILNADFVLHDQSNIYSNKVANEVFYYDLDSLRRIYSYCLCKHYIKPTTQLKTYFSRYCTNFKYRLVCDFYIPFLNHYYQKLVKFAEGYMNFRGIRNNPENFLLTGGLAKSFLPYIRYILSNSKTTNINVHSGKIQLYPSGSFISANIPDFQSTFESMKLLNYGRKPLSVLLEEKLKPVKSKSGNTKYILPEMANKADIISALS